MNLDDLLAKWRKTKRKAMAEAMRPVLLRDSAIRKPVTVVYERVLRCERCDEGCKADLFQCLYGNYWLCPKCAKFHRMLSASWVRHSPLEPGTATSGENAALSELANPESQTRPRDEAGTDGWIKLPF